MFSPNKIRTLFVFLLAGMLPASAQTVLNIYPDSVIAPVNFNFTPGVFYVPKTNDAYLDFSTNGIDQNCIRTNVIESALNNATDLNSCLNLLSSVQTDLQNLSARCSTLIFIFEKMPAWLSSSSDGSPAATPGWYVLNTKPPANWNTWQTVVDSITSKIVNQFGISNAAFEIWNEPDLGSWTGTMNEYFELYKRTYDGIKSSDAANRAGGPTVNFWANNIYWQPAPGYISNARADSSLIGQLLDSALVWNKIPDFISWHNFNLSYPEFANANAYVNQKLNAVSIPQIPCIVSEWNAPSQVRDTRLSVSFMLKAQMEMAKTGISQNAIAAWQDFSFSTNEFHNDYGLLSYGAIHKPAYNAVLLSEKLDGSKCKIGTAQDCDVFAAVSTDTLRLLVSNYCPPPIVEALNYTLYNGHYDLFQLDSAGYVNIAANDISHLDSIYRGLISLPNSDPMQIAISNSIPVYQHYDSIAFSPREFAIQLPGYSGNYAAQFFLVDSTHNNLQYRYDSLRAAGYTQSSAIAAILPNQNLIATNVSVNGGNYNFSLQPNAVCLLQIRIPGISAVNEIALTENGIRVYPNPAQEKITIELNEKPNTGEEIFIYNSSGQMVKTQMVSQQKTELNISELPSGIYLVRMKNASVKFIRE